MRLSRLLRRARIASGAEPDVLWLGAPGSADAARVGGKSATLGRLARRWPVPQGFCVPVRFHRESTGAGRQPSRRDIRRLIKRPYRELGKRTGRWRPAVAVRSSAAEEDAADASFAGQHETVLNAVGRRAVAAAVLRCWRSARSARASDYRRRRGIARRPAMGVLVQRLIDADVSAVVFSADPVTGDRDTVLINASWGLGRSVVDGMVTPDSYRVSREPLDVVSTRVADKDVAVVRSRRGTRPVAVADDRRTRPALDRDRCLELARFAIELESEMGWPVDLEYAYRDDQPFLLQCRPITALPTS